MQNVPAQNQTACKTDGTIPHNHNKNDVVLNLKQHKPSIDMTEEASHTRNASQSDVAFSGPLQVSGSSGFAWAKRRFDDSSRRSRSRSSSKSLLFEPSGALELKNNSESKRQENCEHGNCGQTNSKCHDSYENSMHAELQHWKQLEHADPCDASDWYHPKEFPIALYLEELALKKMNLVSPKLHQQFHVNKFGFNHCTYKHFSAFSFK